MNLSIRMPAFAGSMSFYPADPSKLSRLLAQYLHDATSDGEIPKAMIAPHAGYMFSGPIAASIYARLTTVKHRIKRVILIGPSHRVAFRGIAASSANYFATPLGNIPLDHDAISQLLDLPQIHLYNPAHEKEHSLEVQLPFLQRTLDEFTLVPLVVGDAMPEEVAETLNKVWGGDETLIVVSSDLSHYHDYATAQHIDNLTSRAIEELSPHEISFEHACGSIPIKGLLNIAKQHGLEAETVDLRNSGDIAGDKSRVVGYGSYAFH